MPFQHGAVQTVGEEERRRLSQLPSQHSWTPLPLLQRGLLQRPVQAHLTQESLQRYSDLIPGPAPSIFTIRNSTFTNIGNKHMHFLITLCQMNQFQFSSASCLSHSHIPLSAAMSGGILGLRRSGGMDAGVSPRQLSYLAFFGECMCVCVSGDGANDRTSKTKRGGVK